MLALAGVRAEEAAESGATPEAAGAAETPKAEEAETEPVAALDDQIVVTAGRRDQRLADVPVAVTLLSVEEIERTPASTADELLRQVPSFNLQRPNSSRYLASAGQAVSLRGLGGSSASRTLVLVDGVPLNEPFGGFVAWALVPLATVERIEVVPGGGAGAWGNQAMGGVIQLITRRPEPASVEVDARYGSRSTIDATVLGSHVAGPLAVAAYGSHFDTDGYSEVPEEFRGPVDTGNRSESSVGDARLEYAAGSGTRWTAQASYLDDLRVSGNEMNIEDLELLSVRTSASAARDGGRTWRGDLFLQRREAWNSRGAVSDDRTELIPRRYGFDNPTLSVGTAFAWSRPLLAYDHLLTVGVDAQWNDSEVHEDTSWNGERFLERFEAGGQQLLAGIFVEDSAILAERWRLSGGLRLDHWQTDDGLSRWTSLDTGGLLYDEQPPSRSEWIFSPNVGVRYNSAAGVGLRGAVFQSFRAPSPNELYASSPSNRSYLAANNQLDPERVELGTEAGVDFERGPNRARLTVFWNEVADAIAQVTVGVAGDQPVVIAPCGQLRPRGVCSQRRNLDRVRNRGVEVEGEVRPGAAWRLWAGYTYTDSVVTESRSEPGLEGTFLRRMPEHQATAQATWDSPAIVRATLQVRYVGDRYEDDRNTEVIEGGTLVDLQLWRQLGRGFEVVLSVDNLFDAEVETAKGDDFGDLGPPRTIHGGFRYRWRGSRP
jgi:outer membrane receptor protein involved in Fe transport